MICVDNNDLRELSVEHTDDSFFHSEVPSSAHTNLMGFLADASAVPLLFSRRCVRHSIFYSKSYESSLVFMHLHMITSEFKSSCKNLSFFKSRISKLIH